MPRSYREPEYRRRIRDKAAQKKDDTEAEERKTSDKGHIENLAAAIHRVEHELCRSNDESAPEKKRIRRWEKGGVIGLWAAAGVGVAAIWFGTHDASQQRGVMQGQLDEMQAEQRPWVYAENNSIKIAAPLIFNQREM